MATTYAIPDGRVAMAATTYTGTGSALTVANTVNGTSFQPDWVWIKSRSSAYNNMVYDVIRGAGKVIFTNSTSAEGGNSGDLLGSFNSNGFSVNTTFGGGSDPSTDGSGATYVGWQWKAGGTAVSNTAGSITSQVSANATAGFSVVTYTGNLTAGATVGHGLGVAPSMVLIKSRSTTGNWITYHVSTGVNQYLYLNSTAAAATATPTWGASSSTFTLQQLFTDYNTVGTTYVAYCFAPVSGYSAFGSYTGNGSADGPFVYLGFRPRWVMVKDVTSSSAGAHWFIWDSSRNTYNLTDNELVANGSYAENVPDANATIDILSNGFKFRGGNAYGNVSGNTNIYAAFAENPFKYANAR